MGVRWCSSAAATIAETDCSAAVFSGPDGELQTPDHLLWQAMDRCLALAERVDATLSDGGV
jgi:hypothetical protein